MNLGSTGTRNDDDRMRARSAIVTGGGSGIGAATALALDAAGWEVVIVGRRQNLLDDVCARSRGSMVGIAADVTLEADVTRSFNQAIERFGRLDLLFNNAGMMIEPKPVSDVSLADWQAVLDVNLTGAFLCAREAFRLMASQSPQGGRIINNGSVSAHVPRPFALPYTVTKHAMTGLTRGLSLEGRSCNVACGQIDIGNASTDMTSGIAAGSRQADGSIAAEPTMDVRHVARSVVHMAELPLDANVQFMTVMATTMPYIGRG
jgi:NAD(P)-dependent dehydrogenase (short-subunit alcohol dehydrogenase family)